MQRSLFVTLVFCRVLSYYQAREYPKQFAVVLSENGNRIQASNRGQFVSFSEFLPTVSASADAWGYYSDSINETGWSSLVIHSNASVSDDAQAYAAGFLEGCLTFDRIEEFLENMVGHDWGWPPQLEKFIASNTQWVQGQILALNSTSNYWRLVGLTYRQLEGMYDGYSKTAAKRGHVPVTFEKFYSLTLDGDLYDLCVDGCYGPCTGNLGHRRKNSSGHCSVIVKLTADDLKVAHTTWSSFESMTRIYKLIDLQFNSVKIASKIMTFASYPGTMVSVDDFYQTQAGLVITETTESNNNATLWRFVLPNTVLYWARNLVANRVASNGSEWVQTFMQYNSGTYNNQWIIVDFNRFAYSARAAHTQVDDGLLVVLEQLPGSFSHSEDMTAFLKNHSFWVSYNRPFFPEVWTVSNQSALVDSFGEHYTYNMTARAQLFARLQDSVIDDLSLQSVMRHNDFLHDSVGIQGCSSGRSGSNAIAERGDLTSPTSKCISDLGPIDEAATDVKYTTWSLSQRSPFGAMAQAGPPHDPLPVFSWSNAPEFISSIPHRGQPNLWNFDWTLFEW